jgi:8-oxo-dGTP pyrophosphatase MutT (NUDIX family)
MGEPLHPLTAAIDEAEWAQLRRRWPSAARRHAKLEVNDPFLTGRHQTLFNDGRRAEVCYVAYEEHPAKGLLLHVKTIYPQQAYRLPTGGIAPGEPVWDTLLREITEETGLAVGAGTHEVHVCDLLGVLSYELAHVGLARSYTFATYHFLVELPAGAILNPRDPSERIGGWRWCAPDELPAVTSTLAGLSASAPEWADWGRFRALSHQFVAGAMQ